MHWTYTKINMYIDILNYISLIIHTYCKYLMFSVSTYTWWVTRFSYLPTIDLFVHCHIEEIVNYRNAFFSSGWQQIRFKTFESSPHRRSQGFCWEKYTEFHWNLSAGLHQCWDCISPNSNRYLFLITENSFWTFLVRIKSLSRLYNDWQNNKNYYCSKKRRMRTF